jgi:molybdopterin-binding protein
VVASRSGQIKIQADGFLVEAVGDVALGRRVFACLRPEDVTLLPCSDDPAESSPRSSARNCLRGRILRLVPQGPLVKVVIDCGFKVTALITRLSAQEMGLETGSSIDIAFKASAVHLIPR